MATSPTSAVAAAAWAALSATVTAAGTDIGTGEHLRTVLLCWSSPWAEGAAAKVKEPLRGRPLGGGPCRLRLAGRRQLLVRGTGSDGRVASVGSRAGPASTPGGAPAATGGTAVSWSAVGDLGAGSASSIIGSSAGGAGGRSEREAAWTGGEPAATVTASSGGGGVQGRASSAVGAAAVAAAESAE